MTQQGRLQAVMQRYRNDLERGDAAAAKALNDQYTVAWNAIRKRLDILMTDMSDAISGGETLKVSWLYEQHRLESFLDQLVTHITTFADFAKTTTYGAISHAVDAGLEQSADIMHALTPNGVSWSFEMLNVNAVKQSVASLQSGSPLHDLFNTIAPSTADAVRAALITGVAIGHNPRVIARDIQNACDVSRSRALTIARTEALRAYRTAAVENYKANADVIDGWVWSAELGTACEMCTAMSGTFHTLDEYLDSHPNCRCAAIPHTKDWSEILGTDTDFPDTNADIPSGVEWFDDQSAATQKNILGSSKYQAYADGDLQLQDVVGHTHSAKWGPSYYAKSLKQLGIKTK